MIHTNKEKAYMIFLEKSVLLSKKEYSHWREIQYEYYETFKTSLAPMTCEEMISFYESDYGCDDTTWPFTKEQIRNFFRGDHIILESPVNE